MKEVGATDGDNWERRYAEKFGILLAAAILMVRYEIAPWTEERAKVAITNVYNSSRGLTVSVPQATDAFLDKLQKLVSAGKHFPRLEKGESLSAPQKADALGVVRTIGNRKDVTAVQPASFKKLVSPSAVSHGVLQALDARGLIVKDADGNLKRQLLIKGLSRSRARYVCITGLVERTKKAKWKRPKKA